MVVVHQRVTRPPPPPPAFKQPLQQPQQGAPHEVVVVEVAVHELLILHPLWLLPPGRLPTIRRRQRPQ